MIISKEIRKIYADSTRSSIDSVVYDLFYLQFTQVFSLEFQPVIQSDEH